MIRYVTLSDIRRATKTSLPVVSNWRRRYADEGFPEPVRDADGQAQFDEEQVRAFLLRKSAAGTRTQMIWHEDILGGLDYARNALWRSPDLATDSHRSTLVLLALDLVMDVVSGALETSSLEELLEYVEDEKKPRFRQYYEEANVPRDRYARSILSTTSMSHALALLHPSHREWLKALRSKNRELLAWNRYVQETPVPHELYEPLLTLADDDPGTADELWACVRDPKPGSNGWDCGYWELVDRGRRSFDRIDLVRDRLLFSTIPIMRSRPLERIFFNHYGTGDTLHSFADNGASSPDELGGLLHRRYPEDEELSEQPPGIIGWSPDPHLRMLTLHRLWHSRVRDDGHTVVTKNDPFLTASHVEANASQRRRDRREALRPWGDWKANTVIQLTPPKTSDATELMRDALELVEAGGDHEDEDGFVFAVTDYRALQQPGRAASVRKHLIATGALLAVMVQRPEPGRVQDPRRDGAVLWILQRRYQSPYADEAGRATVFIGDIDAIRHDGQWDPDKLPAALETWWTAGVVPEHAAAYARAVARTALAEDGDLDPARWIQPEAALDPSALTGALQQAHQIAVQLGPHRIQEPEISTGDQARRLALRELNLGLPDQQALRRILPVEAGSLQPADIRRGGHELPKDVVRVITRSDVLSGRLRSNVVTQVGSGDGRPRTQPALCQPGDVLVTLWDSGRLVTWILDQETGAVGPDVVGLRIIGEWISPPVLAALVGIEPSGRRNPLDDLYLPEIALHLPDALGRFITAVTARRDRAKAELGAWDDVLQVTSELAPTIAQVAE